MRLTCFSCGKSVSNEVPQDTVVRATLICPECLERTDQDKLEEVLKGMRPEPRTAAGSLD